MRISSRRFFSCRLVAFVAQTNNHRSSDATKIELPVTLVDAQQLLSCKDLAKYKHNSFQPSTYIFKAAILCSFVLVDNVSSSGRVSSLETKNHDMIVYDADMETVFTC